MVNRNRRGPDTLPARPRIGIAGRDAQQVKDYSDAVEAAGGEPVPLFPGVAAPPAELLEDLDGLILTGGRDVHPAHYGQLIREGVGVDLDEARDALEIPLARAAMQRDLPVLGICRGVQVMNVAAGGTLHQDITLAGIRGGTHNQRAATPMPPPDAAVHEITVTPGSRLAGILGATRIGVNTFHHQTIDRPGGRFSVVARSLEPAGDGVVEAVEVPGRSFVLGVQWHPERMWRRVPANARLFAALVTAAARKPVG